MSKPAMNIHGDLRRALRQAALTRHADLLPGPEPTLHIYQHNHRARTYNHTAQYEAYVCLLCSPFGVLPDAKYWNYTIGDMRLRLSKEDVDYFVHFYHLNVPQVLGHTPDECRRLAVLLHLGFA